MPRWSVQATELTNTDVNFVALVKRGANRIPFRLTKTGDEPMLDLYKIGRSLFRKGEDGPSIVAIVCQKSADINAIKAALVKAEIDASLLTQEVRNGVIYLAKADAESAENVVLLKVSDEVAIAVSGIRKGIGEDGLANSPSLATEMFQNSLGDILSTAFSIEDAVVAVTKAADDYRDYVANLVSQLPIQALKADVFLKGCGPKKAKPMAAGGTDDDQQTGDQTNGKVQKADAGKNGTGAGFEQGAGTETSSRATDDDDRNTPDTQGTTDGKTSGTDSGLPAKAKASTQKLEQPQNVTITGALPSDPESAGGTDETDAAKARGTAKDKTVPKTQGTVGGDTLDMSGIPAGVKAQKSSVGDKDEQATGKDPLTGKEGASNLPEGESGAGAQSKNVQTYKGEDIMAAISALSKTVSSSLAVMQKNVDGLSVRVEGVAAQAKKTEAALGGTVFNEAFGDNDTRTLKSENDGAPPLLDTGYSRRSA